MELGARSDPAPGMVWTDRGRGGSAARHLSDLDPGTLERPQLDRIERRRRGHELALTIPDDETAIEPDMELELLARPTPSATLDGASIATPNIRYPQHAVPVAGDDVVVARQREGGWMLVLAIL